MLCAVCIYARERFFSPLVPQAKNGRSVYAGKGDRNVVKKGAGSEGVFSLQIRFPKLSRRSG